MLASVERQGTLSSVLRAWSSEAEASRCHRGAALFDAMSEQLRAAQHGRFAAERRCAGILGFVESREALALLKTIVFAWQLDVRFNSRSQPQAYCPQPRAPRASTPRGSVSMATPRLDEHAASFPMSTSSSGSVLHCPPPRRLSSPRLLSASCSALGACEDAQPQPLPTQSPGAWLVQPSNTKSVTRRPMQASSPVPAVSAPVAGTVGHRPAQRQPLSDCTPSGVSQAAYQHLCNSAGGGEQQPRSSLKKGPERFFYDSSSYTGCARYGGPSVVDKKENRAVELRPRGSVGTGGGSPRLAAVGCQERQQAAGLATPAAAGDPERRVVLLR